MKLVLMSLVCLISTLQAVNWNGNNWALRCDFRGNDLQSVSAQGDQCGSLCTKTNGCTHWAFNRFNGGTCWLKRGTVTQANAFDSSDPSSACGVVSTSGSLVTSGLTNGNILATRHGATEIGACSLPKADYSVRFPVALGDIPQLNSLRFTPDLCGHIISINCGNGDLDIIVTNSNLGGGLDLYGSTWDRATSFKPPGETKCSAKLQSKSIFNFEGYRCYHSTGETNNQYYRNVGLLNTKERIVTGASYGGRPGAHRGANPYFAFDGFGTGDQKVVFFFKDGGSHEVLLRDCLDGSQKQVWQ